MEGVYIVTFSLPFDKNVFILYSTVIYPVGRESLSWEVSPRREEMLPSLASPCDKAEP